MSAFSQPPQPRVMGSANWLGLWTLYMREVRRFVKVHQQTIWAPVVTTLLFYAVFALALGGASRMVGGVPYMEFLAPGLIMMAMTQNAFANTSSSVVIAKVQGNIVDILMPPLSPGEMVAGFVLGGLTRGLCVGLVTGVTIAFFVPIKVVHPGFVLYHAIMASTMLSLIGFIGGVWSEKFDNIAAVTNFVVTPLAFLSGTFYSVKDLPPFFWWVAHLDPFFYMIDGIRYGFIDHSDGYLSVGLAVMLACNAGLWWLAWKMVASGYKLKS